MPLSRSNEICFKIGVLFRIFQASDGLNLRKFNPGKRMLELVLPGEARLDSQIIKHIYLDHLDVNLILGKFDDCELERGDFGSEIASKSGKKISKMRTQSRCEIN